MNLTVRAEDIMTPRRQLTHAADDAEAEAAAKCGGFDAVPLLRRDGLVHHFWSRAERKSMRISSQHRTLHDSAVERLLPALGNHVVQFVYYRSEMVGLIDASDLNKPIARMVWLQPMLELERAILDAVRDLRIDNKRQAVALENDLTSTQRRQNKAQRHDLEMPLLEYAQFPALLRAAVRLGICQISERDITELNEFRTRAAHGARHAVIEDRSDCDRLTQALKIARGAARCAGRRSART
jgi:hypothetical protein